MTTSTPATGPIPFTIEREAMELRFRITRLASREWVAPDYVRVRLRGDDLVGFAPTGVDDHIRIFLTGTEEPESIEALRALPSREFTPLEWDDDWLDLEFAVHGDEGVAGVWAATAPIGSVAGVGGPRGSMHIEGAPDGWLLAGDETAVPQIRRYLELVPAGAPARVLVEVADADHEIPIDSPVDVTYVHRGDAPHGEPLSQALDALTAGDRPAGSVFGFVAAEQGVVKPARALLCDRWGLSTDDIVVKGYWKREETGATYHAAH